ncbi:MAG: hypothetical protein ACLQM8_04580 [Limisphaerales bacterium]
MNDKHFFPENIRPDLPKFELLKSILLYDPSQHRDGLDVDQALKATPFFAYLGSTSGPKPWIQEWISEVTEVRRQAVAELGEKAVNELWSRPRKTLDSEDENHKLGEQKQKPLGKRIAYW